MARSIPSTNILILIILAVIILVSFILRALPALYMDLNPYGLNPDPDTYYIYRQIEVMVSNFPQYNWFDPMTAFPFGKHIDWGPLFPFIAALFAVVSSATERFDILAIASWTTVVLALLMILVVFLLARLLSEWKTGIIAAIFIALVSGEYFLRSSFGPLDHHIAEVLFTTLFCLGYIWILKRSNNEEIDLRKPGTAKNIILPSILTGVLLGASLLVALTCLLFVLIMAVYILLQYIWNAIHAKKSDYLLITGVIIFLIAAGCLLLVGTPSPEYNLSTYSLAPIHLFIFLIGGLIFLQILSMATKERPWLFISVVVITSILIAIVLTLLETSFFSNAMHNLSSFFSTTIEESAINELESSSFSTLMKSYNIGIFLAIIGLILIIHEFIKNKFSEYLFVGIWGTIILIITIQQARWEYYFSVIVAVLSAYTLGYVLLRDRSGSFRISGKKPAAKQEKPATGKRRSSTSQGTDDSSILHRLRSPGTALVLICLVIFSGISVVSDYGIVKNRENVKIPPQWVDTLLWMEKDTPDLEVSYTGPYLSEEWNYPAASYGVLSWWDYGHWITFLGKRISITNPFQDNVNASAEFFLTESEETADEIAHSYGARYIIIDWRMRFGLLGSMVSWSDSSRSEDQYYRTFVYIPEDGSDPITRTLMESSYYKTMISRLYNFDGSMREPDSVGYIEYSDNSGQSNLPVISTAEILNIESARKRMDQFNMTGSKEMEASLVGYWFDTPIEPVPALQHYRLVYESSLPNEDGSPNNNTSVKVFEYVPGARIEGEGIIEVAIQTNLGRKFVYRQESEGGQFILPYSTRDNPYPVVATSSYRMYPSGKIVEVDELEVREGTILSG